MNQARRENCAFAAGVAIALFVYAAWPVRWAAAAAALTAAAWWWT